MSFYNKKKPKGGAYQRACYMLGRKEYGKLEMRRKLIEKGFEIEDIDQAIDKLVKADWLSESRAAESLVRTIYWRGQGLQKLKMVAQQRQIEWSEIEKALDEKEPDWDESARNLVLKKFGPPPFDREMQVKIARTLIQRGFNMDIAWREAKRQEGDDE